MAVELKYKTFDSLLADILLDFKMYSHENMIEPQELIRVARQVTADLGLRIYRTKETILDINHKKSRLPDDYHVFNYGLMCGEGMIKIIRPQGTHIREVPFPQYQSAPSTIDPCTPGSQCPTYTCGGCNKCAECTPGLVVIPGYNPLEPFGDPCIKPRVFMDCKGESFELVQIVQTETRRWKMMLPLRLVSAGPSIATGCPNLYSHCPDHIWIKDGFLHTNFSCGAVYLNYEGTMEDEEGNLLVLDHDIITPYYEYKLKHRLLENLFFNGEDVQQKLIYIKSELRTARLEALNIVRTPNFEEMKSLWKSNRQAYNNRYVDMFVSNWGMY